MKVTYSSGKNNKIHISTDGEYRFTVDADFWFSLCIYQGSELSEEEVAELKEKIGVRRAFNKGMDFISRRSHSKKELIEKISKTNEKKYAIIACDLLEERGYISDESFAEQYFDYLKRIKHFGKNRIKLELSKKGIDKLIIQNLFENDYSEPEEEIKALLQTKFSGKLSDEKSKKRTINSLLRMGYGFNEIRSAISEYESQEYYE